MASSGPLAERVTVTMPAELVAEIDRIERIRLGLERDYGLDDMVSELGLDPAAL